VLQPAVLRASFEATLVLVGANRAKGKAADDGHVFSPMAGMVTRKIVAKFDIEEIDNACSRRSNGRGRLWRGARCRGWPIEAGHLQTAAISSWRAIPLLTFHSGY
jgi:hypothetical protein